MKLILSSFAVFALIFGAWHFALKQMPSRFKAGGNAGSQWEQNLMTLQRFVQQKQVPGGIVVGSSLAARISQLPEGFSNLALPGESSFTGLELMLKTGRLPRTVLIETNVLNVDENRATLQSLTNPLLAKARLKLPELLETSKPHHVLLRAMDRPDPPGASEAAKLTVEQFDARVRRRMTQLATPLESSRTQAIIAHLRRCIDELQRRHVRVVLFEMPEHPETLSQPQTSSLQAALRSAFPANQYTWMPDQDAREYQTTDAMHLDRESAQKYSQRLWEFVGATR